MAKPVVYRWPAADEDGICLSQTTVNAGNLVLNGALVSNGVVSFVGIYRTVSLTSANNLSTENFTITGTLNGELVNETIVGPNNNTVYTTQLFDSITSISVDNGVVGISVGTGNTGMTHWFNSNYHSTVLGMSVQIVVSGANIIYSFQTTLDDVQTNSEPTTFKPIDEMTDASDNQLASYNVVNRYSNIVITGGDGTETLVATFLQQGIT